MRIRELRPEMWSDKNFKNIYSFAGKLLYIAMITYSDDYGFFKLDPEDIYKKFFSGDKVFTQSLVQPMMCDLVKSGSVQKINFNDRELFYITGWLESQVVCHKGKPKHFHKDDLSIVCELLKKNK